MNVETMAAMKEIQSTGETCDRAFLVSAGTLVTAPGGHGTQYEVSIPTISKPEEGE